jgi:predicted O-methyltransferase YrrM
MTDPRWDAVDRYASDLLVRPPETLDAALHAAEAAGLPAISVSAPQGKFLMLLAQSVGARRILEIGTLAGYSAIWLARALPPGGSLVTLEVEPRHASVARENIARAGFSDVVDLRLGPAIDTLTSMVAGGMPPFDVIFIDADKPSYPEYLPLALALSRVGTVIIADNVVRKGAVLDADSGDERVQGVRQFNELVARHPRLDATLLQTVGSKGYDGFTLARVARPA